MMYSEFLELTGLSEKDINFHQYQSDIEPAYTFIESWKDKQQFCDFYAMFGYDIVSDISGMCKDKNFLQKHSANMEKQYDILREKYDAVQDSATTLCKLLRG